MAIARSKISVSFIEGAVSCSVYPIIIKPGSLISTNIMEAEKYTFFFNIYLRQKKMSGKGRRIGIMSGKGQRVGKLSENSLMTLASRKSVGKQSDDISESENSRMKISESENCWKTVGKQSDDISESENCRKTVR